VICLSLGVGVFATPLFASKPNFLLGDIQALFSSVPQEQQQNLIKQNEDLKNVLYASQHEITFNQTQVISAKVFSLYPFNTKNRLFLDKGLGARISTGNAVLFSDRVLVGQVVTVRQNTSEVQSIFDGNLTIPVRMGSDEVNGLLRGGVNPRITLIDKTKKVQIGDLITSAAKDLPYGLTIGSVREVHEDSLGAFLEASIDTPYTINDLRTVLVTIL
jgi:rod shape-determining protein MreC